MMYYRLIKRKGNQTKMFSNSKTNRHFVEQAAEGNYFFFVLPTPPDSVFSQFNAGSVDWMSDEDCAEFKAAMDNGGCHCCGLEATQRMRELAEDAVRRQRRNAKAFDRGF